jgi:hypothetical protein
VENRNPGKGRSPRFLENLRVGGDFGDILGRPPVQKALNDVGRVFRLPNVIRQDDQFLPDREPQPQYEVS